MNIGLDHTLPVYCAQHKDNAEPGKAHFIPRVERPDALLLADPEQSVEHAPVAYLRVLGLTLDLQPGLSQVDGKRPCGLKVK